MLLTLPKTGRDGQVDGVFQGVVVFGPLRRLHPVENEIPGSLGFVIERPDPLPLDQEATPYFSLASTACQSMFLKNASM